jgi:predicted nicotinamide N-methyase
MNSQINSSELYLSDIHNEINRFDNSPSKSKTKQSRIEFIYKMNKRVITKIDNDGDYYFDEDNNGGVLLLEHSMETTLLNVGLQLWKASLYLSEYVLSNWECFNRKVIVELGAGVGILTIISSLFAEKVISTDLEHILTQTISNYENNKSLITAIKIELNNCNSN